MSTNNIQICCVIGHPVKHSLSPAMHNAAFRKLKLNYTYLALPVLREELKITLDALKLINTKGLNVTIPHKVEVLKYLDKIDPLAKKIGAVNTIVNIKNKLIGYNTDAYGAIDALGHKGVRLKDKNVVVLGSGGSARAITFALLQEKASSITVLNRTPSNAFSLIQELGTSSTSSGAGELNNSNLKKYLDSADICINTTSLGMTPRVNSSPVPKRLLNKNLTMFDIVYNPRMTKLLKEAKNKGCNIISGELMLLYQGARAFKLFTGKNPPLGIMLKTIIKNLK
ncbi:shikimate dehydrogenase [Candidatus Micrarchaeota archaeon]|nr:shikimate dehydrogenase [Candidatus Micrarchaeota archaeon]